MAVVPLCDIESELVLIAEPWLKRYGRFDMLLRQLLWWRAFWKLGPKDADEALTTRDEFVQVCLLGVQPAVAAGTDKATGVRHAAHMSHVYTCFSLHASVLTWCLHVQPCA